MPMVAALAVLLGMLADFPARFHVGPTTVMGILSGLFAVALVLASPLLLMPRDLAAARVGIEPCAPGRLPPAALWIFLLWAAVSIVIFGVSVPAVQNLAIFIIFVGVAAFTSIGASTHSPQRVSTWMIRCGWVLGVGYAAELTVDGLGAESVLGSRTFAITALVFLATLVAWLPARRRRSDVALICLLFIDIALSLSRMSTLAAAILIGVGLATWSSRRGILRRVIVFGGIALVTAWWLFEHFAPLHDRFTRGDSGVLGGFAVNTEGRLDIWAPVWDSARQHLWLGGGAGSAVEVVTGLGSGTAQPHNDYLRLLHDYGIVGVVLLAVGLLWLIASSFRAGRQAENAVTAAPHWAAVLAMFAVAVLMWTDNPLVYAFVMAPLGVLVGLSLASQRASRPREPETRSLVGAA
jgi:O-antigen ligase